MKQSRLFAKTTKEAPADAESANARLLTQAGYVHQLSAGIYSYLPLGLRVLDKIKNIVREEMNALGAQEVSLPMLTPKQVWVDTGRWDTVDVLYKLEGHGKEYALAATAEDVITPLVKHYANSYKDFPVLLYQLNDKFRNEARAKSGLLRGREFSMKDLYSFHLTQEGFMEFYEKSKEAYLKVYKRCGLDAMVVKASGGEFTEKYSHEFQVPTEAGEDYVYVNKETKEALNKEVVPEEDLENTDKYDIIKTIEVGNIFPLETRFSDAIDFTVLNEAGEKNQIVMGSYGIGPSRVMGSIVEVHNDDRGILWPKSVAPFHVHVITLASKDDTIQERINTVADELHTDLEKEGIEVLWDDRDARPGEKFADSDLIGIPLRLVVSEKSLMNDEVEWKERASENVKMFKLGAIKGAVSDWMKE
jgi:prolyl-tRNA synthetase